MMFWLSGHAAVVMMQRQMLKTTLSTRGSYNVLVCLWRWILLSRTCNRIHLLLINATCDVSQERWSRVS